MNISISKELEERLQHMVACGSYESMEAALEAAVYVLEEYEKEREFELTIARGMVRQASEAVEQGEYRTYTKENLRELFDEVKSSGRVRAKRRKERERREILGEPASD